MYDTPKPSICAQQVQRAYDFFSLRLYPVVSVLMLLFFQRWHQTFMVSTQAPLCPAYLISSPVAKYQPATIFGHSAPFFSGITQDGHLSVVIEARMLRSRRKWLLLMMFICPHESFVRVFVLKLFQSPHSESSHTTSYAIKILRGCLCNYFT